MADQPETTIFCNYATEGRFAVHYVICKKLSCGKGLATHRQVDGIEDAQSMGAAFGRSPPSRTVGVK